jgi:hypothetical protein
MTQAKTLKEVASESDEEGPRVKREVMTHLRVKRSLGIQYVSDRLSFFSSCACSL